MVRLRAHCREGTIILGGFVLSLCGLGFHSTPCCVDRVCGFAERLITVGEELSLSCYFLNTISINSNVRS